MTMNTENTHGGARENAGRKATGNVTVALRLTPEEKDKLETCGWSYFVKEALECATVEYKVRDALNTAGGVCSRDFLWCYEDEFDIEASNDQEAWSKIDEIQAKHDVEARKGVDNGEFSEEEFNNAPCYASCLWKEIYLDGNFLFKIYLDISTRQ